MARTARSLEERLDLHPVGDLEWVNVPDARERHVFGGLLAGQALRAAALTVDPRWPAQSIHGTFLEAGDGRQPIRYHVAETRTGSSFATRTVSCTQHDRQLFSATASFHAPEDCPEYQLPMPDVGAPPESFPSGRYDSPWFDSRDVPVEPGSLARRAWFRARLAMPDDPRLHAHAVTYLSDYGPTRSVRQPHADHPGVEQRMSVSLDHTVWLHRPGRVDRWTLFELVVRSTGAGRGLTVGTIWSEDGTMLASVAQEALLRLPDGFDG